MKLLFVANGHGETAIAGRIAAEVERCTSGALELDLFPVVGTGAGAAPLRLVGPSATMPSGGLVAMGNVRAFANDLRAGFAGLFVRQLAFLRSCRGHYDAVLAVGDAYALALAFITGAPVTFVGTAKSVYVAPYGPFERTLLRRARHAFVRDEPTARRLREQNVEASAPGNVIVDLVPHVEAPVLQDAMLGLLPGSRAEAYDDGVRLARVFRSLADLSGPARAIFSIAPTLDAARFARSLAADGWNVLPGDGVHPFSAVAHGATIDAWSGSLGEVLRASSIVLGQAGTANEQAAALGVPVVALGDADGREDWYRMRQRRLLGDALAIVPSEPDAAARAIAAIASDPVTLERMRATGRDRMGLPGGAAAIARAVLAV